MRKSGVVRIGPRYSMLDADDGFVWRLRSEDDLAAYTEQRVTIEAHVSAADELIVIWIGPEAGNEMGRRSN